MTRIASYAANQNIVNFMLRAQKQFDDTNIQVSSGKISQDYLGISAKVQLLLSYENKTTLLDRYRADNSTADFRLETSGVTLSSMESTLTDIRQILRDFDSDSPDAQSVEYIQDWAFRTLIDLETYLNSEADGRYLYSGSRVTTRPVDLGLSTLADFQATYDGSNVTYPTTRDAHIAQFSISQDENYINGGPFLDASNWMSFYQDNDNDQFSSGSSTVQAPSSLFGNVQAGSIITISGTTGGTNDGSYTVSSVSGDTVTINTVMLTDENAIGSFVDETLTDPHGATITTGDGTAYTTTETGDLVVDGTNATLTAATVGAFSAISIGDHVQISGTASNNGTFEVTNVVGDVLTLATNTSVTFDLADGTTLSRADTGNITFDRSANSITAATADAFANVSVGEVITVSGSGQNDGTYTVASTDGTTLTIEATKFTDQGVTSGSTFYDYPSGAEAVFDSTNSTITIQDYAGTAVGGVFSDYQVGDSITVGNTTISPTLYTRTVFTSVGLDQDTIQVQDAGGTAVTGVFDGIQVGDTVTVTGATDVGNNLAYVVNWVSDDGSTIRVDGNIGAANAGDTASINFTDGPTNMADFTTQLDLQFTDNGATDRITLQDDTATGVVGAFDNMTAGMTVTIANSTSNDGTYLITNVDSAGGFIDVTAVGGGDPGLTTETSVAATTITGSGNDGTYTISAISSDGSQITVDSTTPLTADQTVSNGAALSSSTRGLSYTAGTRLLIDDAADSIQIVNAQTGAAVTEAVDGLAAGMTIRLNGTQLNDGYYTIDSINSTTATISLSATTPISGGDENFMASALSGGTGSLTVYGTAGSVTSGTDYYSGDEVSVAHRVENGRNLYTDINALDPTFERAIRALSIIAQGEFGTAGGLDQNIDRVSDAIYLLDMSLGEDRVSPAPYGTEESGDITTLQQDVAFDRLVIQRTIEQHTTVIESLTGLSEDIENADPLETITRLLSQQTSMEASFQAISRVRTLSLVNFL